MLMFLCYYNDYSILTNKIADLINHTYSHNNRIILFNYNCHYHSNFNNNSKYHSDNFLIISFLSLYNFSILFSYHNFFNYFDYFDYFYNDYFS